jgi:hypothetical protein
MDYVALALSLLQTVLASAQVGKAEQEIIAVIQDAITKLSTVEGSTVTYQQLESLRSKVTF